MIKLISAKEVQKVIDNAEHSLSECYDILRIFKSPNNSNSYAPILDFQPKLAECLYSLMLFYQRLKEEERSLIANKQTFIEKVFREHMKTNATYKHAISDIINMGKSLGDVFAWFFFDNNRDELEKHLKHESTGLFPNGIGGLGEIEFIKNNQVIDGLLVIYHSITNMLRIGDFSLYAFGQGIVGNGELKTQRGRDGLIISANILSKIRSDKLCSTKEKTFKEIEHDFPRIKKQLDKQISLLKTQRNPNKLCSSADYEYSIINKLSMKNKVAFNEDCSLGLLAIHDKRIGLSSRLLNPHDLDVDFKQETKEMVDKMMVPNSPHNCFQSWILETEPSNAKIPIFWWNIDDEKCKALYFKQMTIVVFFNSAQLLALFESEGYTIINGSDPSKTAIIKVNGELKQEFRNIQFIYQMIMQNLMKTTDAFGFIKPLLQLCENGEIQPDSQVEMHINLHNFGVPTEYKKPKR